MLGIQTIKPLIASADYEGKKVLAEIQKAQVVKSKDGQYELIELELAGRFEDTYGESYEAVARLFKSELRICARQFGQNEEDWKGKKVEFECIKKTDKYVWKVMPL